MIQGYGSKYEFWNAVHSRATELDTAIRSASPSLRRFAREIEWLAPSMTGGELRDTAWSRVGLPAPSPQQAGWWPRGGPTWDGVARLAGADGRLGALFVEAKGHAREIKGPGTRANLQNRGRIRMALEEVKQTLGVSAAADWLGPLFQPANRLAWIWFGREHGYHRKAPVEVWLASVYFCGGVYPWKSHTLRGPASEEDWRPLVVALHEEMGLPDSHRLRDRLIEVFLPAAEWAEGDSGRARALGGRDRQA